jgi:hypothetical protein
MGLFYSNLAVYRSERSQVLSALRKLRRNAFVSPTVDGHTIIFDHGIEGQNADEIERFGIEMTFALSCVALVSVLHDDDVLYLWLFGSGKILDHYDSLPQYFDPVAEPGPPEGGNSRLLSEAFDRSCHREKVDQLLRANLPDDELPGITGEFERHQALARELGMPPIVAGLTYSSIAGDYFPDEFIPVEFRGIKFDEIRMA